MTTTAPADWISQQPRDAAGWSVIGGVFADGSFATLEPGAEVERHGPYPNETAATKAWQDQARRNIDICYHRLWVVPPATAS